MNKAEIFIRWMNILLVFGLFFIPMFTGLLRMLKMPVREGFKVATISYLIAFVLTFIGIQFALK